MVTEKQISELAHSIRERKGLIRELAYSIWEQEGRPNGKDVEHYLRAKRILEERELLQVIELAPPPTKIALEPPPSIIELGAPPRSKRRNRKIR